MHLQFMYMAARHPLLLRRASVAGEARRRDSGRSSVRIN